MFFMVYGFTSGGQESGCVQNTGKEASSPYYLVSINKKKSASPSLKVKGSLYGDLFIAEVERLIDICELSI